MKRLKTKAVNRRNVTQEPKIEIDYNDYQYKWYKQNGLEVPQRLNDDVRRFIAAVDPSKPIRRNVTRMYRIKALDFLSEDDHPKKKEFLVVVEDWFGKRADNTEVPPVRDHVNGVFNELKLTDNNNVDTTGNRIYYIPFSKEEVDEWLDRSYLQDKDSILFVVDTKQGGRRKPFTYDEFVNSSWEELETKIDERPIDKQNSQLLNIIADLQRQLSENNNVQKRTKNTKQSK